MAYVRRILQDLLLQVFIDHEFINPSDLPFATLRLVVAVDCPPQFLCQLLQEGVLVGLDWILTLPFSGERDELSPQALDLIDGFAPTFH